MEAYIDTYIPTHLLIYLLTYLLTYSLIFPHNALESHCPRDPGLFLMPLNWFTIHIIRILDNTQLYCIYFRGFEVKYTQIPCSVGPQGVKAFA